MNRSKHERTSGLPATCGIAAFVWAACQLVSAPAVAAPDPVAQKPILTGSSDVPGNLFLVPSVEFPTIVSVANLDPSYEHTSEYTGYFDPDKCYEYIYDSDTTQRRFEPADDTSNRKCNGGQSGDWSGNFLNWATTQTITPFRKALTGGRRVVDTDETTWLEKARADGSGGTTYFPDREVTDSSQVDGATPFSASEINIRIRGLGRRMRFRIDNDLGGQSANIAYEPGVTGVSPANAYEVHVRVEVCDEDGSYALEDNCVGYGGNYKPEGLIQENALDLRYSVFGYLNDDAELRDGAVLRAGQKFVGPERIDPASGEEVSNTQREWDSEGRFVDNPNPSDVNDTTSTFSGIDSGDLEGSGVIQYINNFGETTNNDHKYFDPVSELYYAMTRYLRNEGPVTAYHDMSSASESEQERYADSYPVITDWGDPLSDYECSVNVALGIGDVFTHNDKNLPGSPYSADEPSTPSEVSSDGEVDVVDLTNKVGELEGLGDIGDTNNWTGRDNSAYIAGLAYDAHTRDQRPSLTDEQRLSTYWVDVVEDQDLMGFSENQYALAAKYGGFEVPEGYDPLARTDPLEDGWWDSGDTASVPTDSTTFDRPTNFFTASSASQMVESLRDAFDAITDEVGGSAAALAANTTRLTTSTLIYQGRFDSSDWSGNLLAFDVDETDGSVDTSSPVWEAANNIPSPSSREVFTLERGTTGIGNGIPFEWSQLTSGQQSDLDPDGNGQARVGYLRGDASNEARNGGTFRDRPDTVLGDVVNSDPYLARGQNFGYSSLPGSAGSSYESYLASKRSKNPLVYFGANDGMLHAVDAQNTGGDEVFAYVPDALLSDLVEYSEPSYNHQFYVDGSPSVADAYVDLDGTKDWSTVLVSGLRAGGKTVFALDVTDAPSGSFDSSDVLWEFQDPNLGYSFGKPRVIRMGDGKWYAVFGDGYDDTTTNMSGNTVVDGNGSATAGIFFVQLSNPSNVTFFDTGEGSSDDPNGIGPLTTVDLDGDKVTDRIYAGDLEGNLWQIDVQGQGPGSLSNGDRQVLFQATGPSGDPQPITAAPTVGANPNPDVDAMVYFGTGRAFRENDDNPGGSPQVQSFYGLADRGTSGGDQIATNKSTLVQQTIEDEDASFRTLSDNPVDYSAGDDGWFINLESPVNGAEGERVVNKAELRSDKIAYTTNIPEPGICALGGNSWIMEMEPLTGGRIEEGVFDTDGDGDIDNDDRYSDVDGDPEKEQAGGKRLDGVAAGVTFLPPPPSRPDIVYKEVSLSSGKVKTVKNLETGSSGRQSWRQLQ